VGQMSGPSTPLVTVAQLDPMVAVFSLTESQVGKLKTGDQVSVQVKVAGSESWQGQVSEVAPSADPRTRTYLVKVELPNGDGMLKGGMTAQVGLALNSIEDAVVVPVNSVVTKGNRQNIYLLEGERVRECPVEILLQNDELAAVSGEVEAGAQVVIAGQNLLQDGSLVRDVTEEGK
jgi:RND family efflux transporter MFP subunit